MTAKHGVPHGPGGNPWHLIIELFDTHSGLMDTEWYDLANFLEPTMALNGFEMTAEDYDRFVQAHGPFKTGHDTKRPILINIGPPGLAGNK